MATYTTYEAKARLSEILRRVRRGETVRITYYGEEIAEVRPVTRDDPEGAVKSLVASGILEPARSKATGFPMLARRPGALERFLAERE